MPVAVVLARPENPENIGLAARAMMNTGFSDLRIVKRGRLPLRAFRTAVHAQDLLSRAALFTGLADAVADLEIVLAATARARKTRECLTLEEAARLVRSRPESTRVGFLFGNERTGLTEDELRHANFLFTIPQARRQPSYNLGAAVLLTLFTLFAGGPALPVSRENPLSRREQQETIELILRILESKGFIHGGNHKHVASRLHDLIGRLTMTGEDRRFLLALFSKGVENVLGRSEKTKGE